MKTNTRQVNHNESSVDIELMQATINEFIIKRGWNKHRTPKNLVMALSVESAELVEIFQWRDNESATEVMNDPKLMDDVKDELADVLSYLLQLAWVLNINISDSFHNKFKKTIKKYDQLEGRDLS